MVMIFRSHSVAATLATRVFPVPGGPYNKIPVRNLSGHCAKSFGYFEGHCRVSRSDLRTSSRPPISDHPLGAPFRCKSTPHSVLGFASDKNCCKSSDENGNIL